MGKHQKDDFSYWAFQAQKQRLRHTQTAAAPAFATPSVQKTPGWENTMAVKDGKASKLRKNSLM